MKSIRILEKLIAYILGRKPDEYGLVPDENGFVRMRHLLQALHEEEGFGYVREIDILELQKQGEQSSFEIHDAWIRATDREKLPCIEPCFHPPKLLYTAVRRKAYAHVLDRGMLPTMYSSVWLVSALETAQRFGKRIDPKPVVVGVNTRMAIDAGGQFQMMGEMYLSSYIPNVSLFGPPLEKVLRMDRDTVKQDQTQKITKPSISGGYFIDLEQLDQKPVSGRKSGRKKQIEWKKDRRRSLRKPYSTIGT
ncbi:RNA 2'-phosphotransferase [Desulfatirhabdium butyrativorans]|uniref:RNA 2'-phosphotransferase n=1 Tax=Desulfatirhabdium butyrativorans TaxID=340467 RepID=UPI000402A5D0|nr:RNA 2'-phosphotransferase [Desulfatirhabdium butyrativorans]